MAFIQDGVLFAFGLLFLINSYTEGRNVVVNDVDDLSGETSPEYNAELDPDHWRLQAQKLLKVHLLKQQNTNRAKNVIIFLGDGMSIPTLSAARVYMGQLEGRSGEGESLSFEQFPYTGFSKTYCVDMQVADSACSATAYLSGVKANYGTIGVPASVKRKDCYKPTEANNEVTNIMEWAQAAGKHTGIVTTTRVTHASPAGTYAHTGERDWESDSDVIKDGKDPLKCPDIATQLITSKTGSGHKVILGGGRMKFLPNMTIDEDGNNGSRSDGANLIESWLRQKNFRKESASYVFNRKGLLAVSPNIENILGLFNSDHLDYHLHANSELKPTLEDMTRKAIQVLQKSKSGYVLFVEGGRIDQAHHDTYARLALDETVELSKAVKAAVDLTSQKDTLILVTSDHAHTMSYSGYSHRGHDILGLNGELGSDSLPYTTLSYANGPSFAIEIEKRQNMTTADLKNTNFTYPSSVPREKETHGGDDVAVFALGPWAHLFTGFYEQNFIPHSLAYASCIGPGLVFCST